MAILPYALKIGSLFEQDCLLCAGVSDGALLCSACAGDLPRNAGACCPRCALPTNGETCARCLKSPPPFDATLAAFRYEFPVDKLMLAFKYGHRLALAAFFGEQIAARCAGLAADLIVPLPLHRERLRERGFNQALEIARPVAAALALPIAATLCVRTRPTPAQAGLPLRERIRNMRAAFHCTTDLSGVRIVLVDDVMTTGASLAECARTLKLHGAAAVTLLVVARASPKPS
jgi:ComF family protein